MSSSPGKLTNTSLLLGIAMSAATSLASPHHAAAAEKVDISQMSRPSMIAPDQTPEALARSIATSNTLDATDELRLQRSTESSTGMKHLHYEQYHRNIPVWGERVTVTRNRSNDVVRQNGTVTRGISREISDVTPALDAQTALQRAKNSILGETRGIASDVVFDNEKSRLVVYVRPSDNRAILSYEVSFFAVKDKNTGAATRPFFLIDANTGATLFRYEGLTHAEGIGPGGNERTGKYSYGTGGKSPALDISALGSTCRLESGNVITINLGHKTDGPDQAHSFPCFENTVKEVNGAFSPLNDAHHFGNVVYRMYQDWYKQPPLPGKLLIRVHYGRNHENAYWNGKYMLFGDGAHTFYPLVSLDVMAHEVSHGFTETHSGLIYTGQSGAINEAFSDMAGEAAKAFVRQELTGDFLVGSDIFKSPSGALRYMCDPSRDGKSIDNAKKYREGLDVHFGSGVYNKAFCLLAKTPGWGARKAFEIFLVANTDYWKPLSTFVSAARDVVNAATDLGYSVADVKAAFSGVDIVVDGEAATASPISQSPAGKKHAFVVGIDIYDQIRGLNKARGDARAMERMLKELGFDVFKVEDITRSGFSRAWQDFLTKVEPNDTVAIFYAGHGIELGGSIYLIPRDVPKVKASRQEQLKRESISFPELLSDLQERKTKFNLIILDACRENPFDDSETRSPNAKVGLPEVKAPDGTFIMYSAGPRQRALDRLSVNDENSNSVYTRTLLPLLARSDLQLTEMAQELKQRVSDLANNIGHVQRPAYYDGLLGPACLSGTACGLQKEVLKAYENARRSKDPVIFKAFIEAYRSVSPSYADLAQEDLGRLEGRIQPKSESSTGAARDLPKQSPAAQPGGTREKYWPPGTELNICFMDGTAKARARVAEFAQEWTQYANLKFNFGDVSNPRTCSLHEAHHIRITFKTLGSNWSYLGTDSEKVSRNLATMAFSGDLGRDELPSDQSLRDAKASILNQFGLAIGFENGELNPRLNCENEKDWEKIYKEAAAAGQSKARVDANWRPSSAFDDRIEPDTKSIMYWSWSPEYYKQGRESRCWSEQNYVLSTGDKKSAAIIYPSAKEIEQRQKLLEEYKGVLRRSGFAQGEVDGLGSDFMKRLERITVLGNE